jgi:fructose 1,6-bisphosphate aldolase/phosphatase
MRITLSVIKADIGSVGGHLKPSRQLLEGAQAFVDNNGRGLLDDFYISHTGDDIALLFIHQKGPRNEDIHKLAWDAFLDGTKVAKEQGLYGAGQDLLKDAFSGTLVGMGPAVAEMEIVERPSEPFLFFAADKSDPGAYNLPLFLAFADPHVLSRPYVEPKDGQGLQVQYHGC